MKERLKSNALRPLLAAAVLAATSLCAHAAGSAATPFTSLYVFGDSLSDNGNNAIKLGTRPNQVITGNSYIPTFPYASGDYSNGPVWVSAFAAGLGLSSYATASLAGGGDYAYGGALTTVDGNGGKIKFPPSATTQVNTYLAGQTSLPASALYVVAIGGNDAFDTSAQIVAGAPEDSTIASASAAYAAGVGAMVSSLQAKGAQHIVVWDTPDIGLTPSAAAAGVSALDTKIATAFNTALGATLAGDPVVTTFDVFGLLDRAVADPAAYGLTNVTDACGALANCDPATYLFWDGIHPTSAGHALIAQAMLAAVPEPASAWLLAGGLVVVVALARRRRSGGHGGSIRAA
jgi:phospholipase/lecithinase/hemolysin